MRRRPAVSGQFYLDSPAELAVQVQGYVSEDLPKKRAIGILSPHAGLVYSGHVAGSVYSGLEMPDTFVLLGPNHTGLGSSVSVMPQGEWEVPTCIFRIDEGLSQKILRDTPVAMSDAQAHLFEHSLEVQLPFLAYFSREVKIVPIAMLSVSLEDCLELAGGIAQAVKEVDYPVVIVASSDMSHYVPEKVARQKDKNAIDKMLHIDPEGLYETVRRERITMCGVLPATVMLAAARLLGAGTSRLVRYATSGEVSGDYESVVGYAGIVVR